MGGSSKCRDIVIKFAAALDQIVCVDSSWPRLKRLRDTFRWYIPGVFNHNENIAEPVVVLHDDGRAMGDRHPDRYDKVRQSYCNTYCSKMYLLIGFTLIT